MKAQHKYVLSFFLIIFLLITCLPNCKASSNGINWYSYEEGIEIGKKEKKKMFLYFWASWCAYCTKMANETFKDPSVASYLNENFIPIKVNTDTESKIGSLYKVRGLPDSWFITETGENISHQPGYIPAAMLIKILKYIHTDSYKKMTFNEFITSMKKG